MVEVASAFAFSRNGVVNANGQSHPLLYNNYSIEAGVANSDASVPVRRNVEINNNRSERTCGRALVTRQGQMVARAYAFAARQCWFDQRPEIAA
jgi:hypothetical protein